MLCYTYSDYQLFRWLHSLNGKLKKKGKNDVTYIIIYYIIIYDTYLDEF